MLFVFIEGFDDERFFSRIYGRTFGECKYIQYSSWNLVKTNNFLKSIDCMPNSDYIFLADADGKTIEEKREQLLEQYANLCRAKVFIVQYEIESWYYAGIDEDRHVKLKLSHYTFDTNCLTKEQFYAKLPKRGDRQIIMAELLNYYDVNLAVLRNNSLSVFHRSQQKEPA